MWGVAADLMEAMLTKKSKRNKMKEGKGLFETHATCENMKLLLMSPGLFLRNNYL